MYIHTFIGTLSELSTSPSNDAQQHVRDDFLKDGVLDIGLADRRNMQHINFLRCRSEIPFCAENVLQDCNGKTFSKALLKRKLPNGESIQRDWLCYSKEKNALYCLPCFLAMPGDHHNIPSFAKTSGWSGAVNGWSKLKDRIPDHEKTLAHQKFYVAWKSRISKGVGPGLVDTLFAQKIQAEVKNCKEVLKRILDCILFLGENGASFLGSSHVFAGEHSGMFLKLIELLSEYDPVLAAHTNGSKELKIKTRGCSSITYLRVHRMSSLISAAGKCRTRY